MERRFTIDSRQSVGNLHVSLTGEFNDMCAWELIKTIRLKKNRRGRVFVNTNGLKGISSDGIDLFKTHICGNVMKQDWLYFKGDKGFEIAPDGSRVLIPRKNDGKNKKENRKRRFGRLRSIRSC